MIYKFNIFLFFFFSTIGASSQINNYKEIRGKVYHQEFPIEGVIITNTSTNKNSVTSDKGHYQIMANAGHILRFTHVGFEDKSIIIEDVTDILNINLASNELDELYLESQGDPDSARLGYSKDEDESLDIYFKDIDLKRAAFSNNFIKGSDISNIHINIQDALVGKVSGYTIHNGKSYLRGRNSSILNDYHAVWDVDGTIFTENPIVDINNIKAVYFLKSLAYTAKYGSIGNGGVIVIVTHNGPYDNNPIKKKELEDLQNKMLYDNDALIFTGANLKTYSQKESNNHPEKLKAVAFNLQKEKELDSTVLINEKVFNLRPAYAQSYRDLANAYVDAGEYHKAWKLYMSYAFHNELKKEEGIGEIIYNEMEWLYYNRNAAAKITQRFEPSYRTKKDFEKDIRIVFEWNTSEAEFDLEFVNPEQQVYTFEHTLEANETLITDEKTKGYSSKEFSIPEIDHRDWLVNMTYYGNKKYDPTYFKVTTYYNWGRPNQTQKVRVFQLEDTDVKYQLLKYNNNSLIINY